MVLAHLLRIHVDGLVVTGVKSKSEACLLQKSHYNYIHYVIISTFRKIFNKTCLTVYL